MTGSGNNITSEHVQILKLRRLRRKEGCLVIRKERSLKVKINHAGYYVY